MVVMKEISIMIFIYLHLHLYLLISGTCLAALAHNLETDKESLLAFRRGISDPYSILANWNESNQVCNFTGVSCGRSRHRVFRLSRAYMCPYGKVLSMFHEKIFSIDDLIPCFSGTLSPSIFNLTQLRRLELINTNLYGLFPPQLSSLAKLERLDLHWNSLSGPIPPDSFSYLRNLKLVNMGRNKLSGPIPPSVFYNCSLLQDLYLFDNQLSGRIPAEIGNCPSLDFLDLSSNQLTGEIPFSLTNATQLTLLAGELPVDIVSRLPMISYLWLSQNKMSSQDGNTNLEPFFTALTNCTGLKELELDGMGLGGRFPRSISTQLRRLSLDQNQIYGEIPLSLTNATQLTFLSVDYNQLSGELPVAVVSRLPNINYLYLSYNKMSSKDGNTNLQPFFTALSNCTQLSDLGIAGMGLGGSFPRSIPTKLQYLYWQENQIHGEIPFSLTNATSLEYLDVEHNHLSGELPVAIGSSLPIIASLRLSYNNMTSYDGNTNIEPFFTALSNCTRLEELRLAGMGLGGSLAQIFGTIPGRLKILDLKENQIRGSISIPL